MKNSPWSNRILFVMIALAVLVSTGMKSVSAQEPWPFKKSKSAVLDPRKVNDLRRSKNQALRALGAPTKEQRDAIRTYYMNHVFAGMTQPAALDDAMRFPNWRREIIGDLEKMRGNATLYRYTRDELCLRTLKILVVGNYHPACRYNAALIIGMLNDQEGDRNAPSPYPVPHAAGRKFLIQVARAKSMPDAVRIAALIGLRRHAELLAASGSSDADLVKSVVDVARAQIPPSSNADAAYWQKRLAIEALGAMGPGGATKVLGPVVNDAALPLSVRCAAARALGQLDYRNVKDVDPIVLLKGLGQVAVSACREEIQRVQQHNQENPEPSRESQPLFRGGQEEKPTGDPIVLQSRRQLKHRLNCVTKGIEGIEKIASQPDQQNTATSIRSEIDAIQRGLDDGVEAMTPQDLLNKIGPPAVRLEGAVKDNA